ncbi:MAG: GNAT family N-acetyltransferase [Candidatus Ozemobacteraceae bacterium]
MTKDIQLRNVTENDLSLFFEHQQDPDANRLAAFPARDREAFMTHWTKKILGDTTVVKKTILFGGQIAGNILCFEHSGKREVGYWIGKEYWGQGIATLALSEFLGQVQVRPLYAHVAKHNRASLRVLEKCGFKNVGEDKEFSNFGGESVEGFILRLEANRLKRVIEVVDYNFQWPEEFQKEAQKILVALAKEIIRIHHIGSTAVPGLKAKPVIDILLEVKDVNALDEYDPKMKEIGYIPKGEYGIHGRRFYLKGLYERTHHIHAFNIGSPDVERHIAFRDYLIAHPLVAKEYGDLKARCADECDSDSEKYCDGKHEFVRSNEKKALAWRKFRQDAENAPSLHP